MKLVVKARGVVRPGHKYTGRETDGRGGYRYTYAHTGHDPAAVRRLEQAVAEAGFESVAEAIDAHRTNQDDVRLYRLSGKYRAMLARPPQQLDAGDPNVSAWYEELGIDAQGTKRAPATADEHNALDPRWHRQGRLELSRGTPLLVIELRKGALL